MAIQPLISISILFFLSSLYLSSAVDLKGRDVSEVTWAHAVNSRKELEEHLAGDVDFLEADVSVGHLKGYEVGYPIPVMAHPPVNVSDVTLERWLEVVIARARGKGVKLDFKSIDVVEPSLKVLRKHERKITFPLWLNADILAGPVNSTTPPVSASEFLKLCSEYFPNATLSLGWTTYFFLLFPPEALHYDWAHVRAMADVLRCHQDVIKEVTFPVRAILTWRSLPQLRWLLQQFESSTLTVWSSRFDPVGVDNLLKIRDSFKVTDVYYDIPEPLLSSFQFRKSAPKSPFVDSKSEALQWTSFQNDTLDPSCSDYTYISENSVSFGKNTESIVLLDDIYKVSDQRKLRIEGLVTFYNDALASGVQELTLLLLDLSSLPSNFTFNDTDVRNSDVISQSRLHVFRHDFRESRTSCRYFRLDTQTEPLFQVWQIPCDILPDGLPDSEMIRKHGVSEISKRTRLVLPPEVVRFGMMSSGPGFTVVYNIDIIGDKRPQVVESVNVGVFGPTVSIMLIIGFIAFHLVHVVWNEIM